MVTEDETAITEISIDADGRIFLFGLSCEMLEVLASIFPNHPELMARIAQLKSRHSSGLEEQGNDQIDNCIAPSAR
jgi:hypothetical protein